MGIMGLCIDLSCYYIDFDEIMIVFFDDHWNDLMIGSHLV